MAIRVVVHIHNEDPFVAEMDTVPDPKDNFVILKSPRRRDGKALTFITDGATSFLYPWTRISFLEVIGEPTQAEKGDSIISFFREERRVNQP